MATSKNTLVAFSGGLDSTYLLWDLLAHTDDKITAIFLDEGYITSDTSIGGQFHLAPYERIQTQIIVDWLRKNVRDFTYMTQVVYPDFLPDENTLIRLIRIGAPLLNDGTFDRMAFGYTYDEVLPEYPDIHNPGHLTSIARDRAWKAAVTNPNASLFLPYVNENHKGKMHALNDLPLELLTLTVSCQNPIVTADGLIRNCGSPTCRKCSWIEFLHNKLVNEKYTPDDLMTWLVNERVKTGTFRRGREINGVGLPHGVEPGNNGYLDLFPNTPVSIWEH